MTEAFRRANPVRRDTRRIVGTQPWLGCRPCARIVVDHPLVAHKLTALRDESTDSPTFRRLADELVTLLAYEATRDVRVEPVEITTPVAPTTGVQLAAPQAAGGADPARRARACSRG